MKRFSIIAVLAATALCACGAPPNRRDDFVSVVGADANGFPIQQVVWLYDKADLKKQQCPIWAASSVTVVAEQGDAVKVKADRTALPDVDKWHRSVSKGNIVIGWIERKLLVQVPVEAWKKNRPGAHQAPAGDVLKAAVRNHLKRIVAPVTRSASALLGLTEAEVLKKEGLGRLNPERGTANKKWFSGGIVHFPKTPGDSYVWERYHILTFEDDRVVRHEMVDRRTAHVSIRPREE